MPKVLNIGGAPVTELLKVKNSWGGATGRVDVAKRGHEFIVMQLRKVITGANSMMATAAQRDEGWKRCGVLKGTGLPAPSGRYAVGCVDLMHQVGSLSLTLPYLWQYS